MSGSLTFTDERYFGDAVREACREFDPTFERFIPCMGVGKSTLHNRKYNAPRRTGTEVREIGDGWHLDYVRSKAIYRCTLDADESKLALQKCLRVEPGHTGSLTLPGNFDNRKLEQHLASEVYRRWIEDGEEKEEWKQVGQNHWLDSGGYALMGGRKLGWVLPEPTDDETTEDTEPDEREQGNAPVDDWRSQYRKETT